MSEEQLNASLDAEAAKLIDDDDVELTNEELEGVAGGYNPQKGPVFAPVMND